MSSLRFRYQEVEEAIKNQLTIRKNVTKHENEKN